MNFYVLAFPMSDIAIKRSRSANDHHLNNNCYTRIPSATYQVLRQLVLDKIFKVFPYMKMVTILIMWPGRLEHIFIFPGDSM